MAWAFVQGTGAFTASAGTTRALAYGSNVTSGNRLIAFCVWTAAASATCALTDTQGNVWAGVAGSLATSVANRCQIFHAPAGSSASDTVTMTTSVSTGERVIFLMEASGLSGSLGASPLAANGSSANPSANITIGAATSLLVGGCFTGGTAALGAGYSAIAAVQDGNVGQYRLPAGTGAQAVPFVEAASNTWAISGVEFLISGGGGGTVVEQLSALGVG